MSARALGRPHRGLLIGRIDCPSILGRGIDGLTPLMNPLVIYAVAAVAGGIVAGSIAYSRFATTGVFVGYFIFGALLPLIGIITACFVKPPPLPPGWYPDPWGQASLGWHDGSSWTWHLN